MLPYVFIALYRRNFVLNFIPTEIEHEIMQFNDLVRTRFICFICASIAAEQLVEECVDAF